MLESDYLAQFAQLIGDVDWDIMLPRQWQDFFEEKGHIPTCPDDDRSNQRFRLRTHGLLWFDDPLPAFPRPTGAIGIYTCDFSRQGCGILTSVPLLPGENVRVVLSTFWTELHVVRTRRITRQCFEVGMTLSRRHDPSESAFRDVPAVEESPSL
ncbi:MAG: PilZ domain-containing protein [Planctomycetota bacterium]